MANRSPSSRSSSSRACVRVRRKRAIGEPIYKRFVALLGDIQDCLRTSSGGFGGRTAPDGKPTPRRAQAMLDSYRKLYDLLDARERRLALLVFCLLMGVALVEAAG